MQKPSVGRIVIAAVDPAKNNGADVAPAIITRVFSDTLVNVRVLLDSDATEWQTSVTLYEGPDAFAEVRAQQARVVGRSPNSPRGVYWPPRV